MIYAIEALESCGPCTRDGHRLGLVKIGKARDPEKRLRALSTGSPHELRLLASCDWPDEVERLIHAAFKAKKYNGEWFRPEGHVLSFVSTMMCNHGATDEEKYAACMTILVEMLSGWSMRPDMAPGECRAPDKRFIVEDGITRPNPDWDAARGCLKERENAQKADPSS